MSPAAKYALLEEFDRFAPARNALRKISAMAGEWAGIPVPIDGEDLIVDPSFPMAQVFDQIKRDKQAAPDEEGVKLRNRFWSRRLRADVYVWEEADGKIYGKALPRENRVTMEMHTLGCSVAWGLEQEHKAITLLGTMVRHHQLKTYILTGAFLETSKRSGLTYMFRRLRPTVVIDARDQVGKVRVLGALCAHPIGYYASTFAGAMCPTDDVVAHLAMMRGDEHGFWKRANLHQPDHPQACL